MKHAEIREVCLEANRAIVDAGLVLLTWGNASVADREAGVLAIKPTGVDYEKMRSQDIVIVEMTTGRVVDSNMKPSVDTPIHQALYEGLPEIGSVIHSHSHYALLCAQALREIPCLGTTHADFFLGAIPVAHVLSDEEIDTGYERSTGLSIVKALKDRELNSLEMPGALAAYHGPFAWGRDATAAVQHAVVLEEVARIAVDMGLLQGADLSGIPRNMLMKHQMRKHGPKAYYGQSQG